jgi:hypothetical protein
MIVKEEVMEITKEDFNFEFIAEITKIILQADRHWPCPDLLVEYICPNCLGNFEIYMHHIIIRRQCLKCEAIITINPSK